MSVSDRVGDLTSVSVSVSAQDGTIALGKAHTRSDPSFSSLPKVALQTVPILVRLNTDRSRPWRVESRPISFSTPLSSGDQCCDVLACPCSDSSSSLGAPLPYQAADRCEICCGCQSICPFIPTDSGVPRTVDPQKSAAEDCAWLCASPGSPFQTPHFARGSSSL